MNTLKADNSLSQALRLLRVYKDLSQKDLAEKLEISTSYLSELESAKKDPTMVIVKKYAELFNISPSAILFFSEHLNEEKGNDSFAIQKLLLKTLNYFERFNEKY
tara:strand:- start:29 stop:343 length:315 start_codon:yes stop_codon:yes gene_type:complete